MLLNQPVEIILHITQYLSLRSLANICQTCRHLFATLDHLLYQKCIDIDLRYVLSWAVEQDRLATLTKLVKMGVDLTTACSRLPIISTAGRLGRVTILQLLLDHAGPYSDWKRIEGRSAILDAIHAGQRETLALLMKHAKDCIRDYDIDIGGGHCNAAAAGQVDMVRMLLDNGVKTWPEQQGNATPLYRALSWRHMDVVKLLLQRGAIFERDSPLEECLWLGHRPGPHIWEYYEEDNYHHILELVQLLLDYGAKVTGSAVWMAAAWRDPDVLELLLSHGSEYIEYRDGDHLMTPLLYAVQCQSYRSVECLIGHGANIEATIDNGWTPFFLATRLDSLDIVRLLVDAGANTTVTNNKGESALDCDDNLVSGSYS